MSEWMTPIPFAQLMNWIAVEYQRDGSVFGVHRPYVAGEKKLPIFGGESLEMPMGPAAGPHTQLAQNIVAAYFAGARFFELKTVQQVDGPEMSACISRPCITAEDECYNCEWSTELYVSQAFEEYVKAWCACKMLAKVYGLGDPNGFVFNMSVGYDLTGIQTEKIDRFIEGLKDASGTPVWNQCMEVLHQMYPGYGSFIDSISPRVSNSVTVSTLHGCPPSESEAMVSYLISEKKLHTYVKCNPTLLGYETVRSILDSMGYGYIRFDRRHFESDLQYGDAVPMFRRLWELAQAEGVEFGLKLSNTFPVDVTRQELPAEEMYMAGKALFPLTMEMASRISREFAGKLPISYSGGADYFNVDKIFACGIWPITMCTTILKPGGYQRFKQIGEKLEQMEFSPFAGLDTEQVSALALAARRDPLHCKAEKYRPRQKLAKKVPLLDCSTAPCKSGCPLGQDIPEYLELCRKGRYEAALRVILEKNPLPFITGTVCYHHCMEPCVRNFYERPVQVRAAKLTAAERGYDAVMETLAPGPQRAGMKAAIVGGGPTGMAAAHFLAREGVAVTLFEKKDQLGGVVRSVLTKTQISHAAIDKDAAMLEKLNVDIRLNTQAPGIAALKAQGYTHILLAVGAQKADRMLLPDSGIAVDEKGRPKFRTDVEGVYTGGDCLRGPASVAEAIADAQRFAGAVLGFDRAVRLPKETGISREAALAKKGILGVSAKCEGDRCLSCNVVCQCCADVCPNRANVVIAMPDGRHQILHVDRLCNECGNCTVFCPYDAAPYRDKFTLFHDRTGFAESPENNGFLPLGGRKVLVRLNGVEGTYDLTQDKELDPAAGELILTVLQKYRYLME